MLLLVLGVALWWAAHLFKRIAPDARARLGDKGQGVIAIALVAAIVMMVFGYRSAEDVFLWAAPYWTLHLNNLVVLVAFYMTSPAPKKGKLLAGMRHPMLAGFALWAGAHLVVNGDLASLVLFGGLLLWALTEMVVINRAEPEWQANPGGRLAKDAMFFGASIVLVLVIGFLHGWLGPSPFPGG